MQTLLINVNDCQEKEKKNDGHIFVGYYIY